MSATLTRVCVIEGCDRRRFGRGLCNMHYHRWRRHGDPLRTIRAQRTRLYCESIAASPPPTDECIDWPFFIGKHGYGQLSVIGVKCAVAHRYICQLVHGEPPSEEHEAAHFCGRRSCVNPHHVRWATRRENALDKVAHGTHNRGERSTSSKLTRDDVHEIRRLLAEGVSQRRIARQFGVGPGAVCDINAGRTWGWLA